MNSVQAAILWGMAALDPNPTTTQKLFASMFKQGCFGPCSRGQAMLDFIHNMAYLEVFAEQVKSNDDSCWLTDAGRAVVEAHLAKKGMTIAQMQAEIRESVMRALLEAAPEKECARA